MAIWADYGISAAKYDDEDTHVVGVRAHKAEYASMREPVELTRERVISEIEAGSSFVTMTKRDEKWVRGQYVHLVRVNGVKYIRTDRNETESDNLGDLPRF